MWNNISNGGSDFSFAPAGIFFHLIQFVPFWFGLGLQLTQKISLIFWFSIITISAYIFSGNIVKDKRILRIVFTTLYCLNIYMFNSWENVKVSNLSLVAAIPLLLHTFLKLKSSEWSYFKAGVVAALSALVLSGSGINPAYFLTCFVILFIFTISTFFERKNYINIIKSFLFISLVVGIASFYWLLPTIHFVTASVTQNSSIASIGFNDWIDSLSKNTSIINILRLQGAWDWYSFDSVSKTPLFLPYVVNYIYKIPFIFFSFVVPTLAMVSLFFINRKKTPYYTAFVTMLLLGVFLSSGTHEPTGVVYVWLSKHLPYFSLFRSPWYIFSPMVVLAFSGLVVLFLEAVYGWIKVKGFDKYKLVVDILVVTLITGNIVYCYPLVTGKVFRPSRKDSFFVKFPDYLFQTSDFLNHSGAGRVITYPDDQLEKFNWGYTGVEPVINLLVDRETIFPGINNVSSFFNLIVGAFYANLKVNHFESAMNLARKVGADTILEKRDQETLSSPIGKTSSWTTTQYGNWLIHIFNQNEIGNPKIYLGKNYYFGFAPNNQNADALSLLGADDHLLNPLDSVVKGVDGYKNSGAVVTASNSQTEDHKKLNIKNTNFTDVKFTFDIPQSGNYYPVLENYGLTQKELSDFVLVRNNTKSEKWTVKSINDSYIYFNEQHFEKGKNTLVYMINNNLVISHDFEDELYPFKKDSDGKMLSITNQSEKDVAIDFPFNDLDDNRPYFITLDYQWDYGNNPSVLVTQKNKQTLLKSQSQGLEKNSNKMNLGFYYDPVQTKSTAVLSLVSPFYKDPNGTRVNYDNLKVYKLFTNSLFFVKNPLEKNEVAKIDFKQKSPVRYEGVITGAKTQQTLIFAENYSSGWKIKIKNMDGKEIIFDARHFSIDTYANAWYIDAPYEDYKFQIYYQPQIFFNIGLTITLVFLSIVFGAYFIYERNYKK